MGVVKQKRAPQNAPPYPPALTLLLLPLLQCSLSLDRCVKVDKDILLEAEQTSPLSSTLIDHVSLH